MRWFFYCFLTNIFQITFKYIQNIVIFCFQFVELYKMLRADEDSRMLFLFNELLLYISQCKWNRETRQLVDKSFEFCSISSQESLLQRKVKFNDEMMKRQDGCFKLLCSVLQIWKQWKKLLRSLQLQRMLVNRSNKEYLKKVIQEVIS